MILSKAKLIEALEICAENHSTNVTLNHLMDTDFVPNAHPLVIHECVPAVVDKLRTAGFMLGMTKYGMTVDHFDK